MYIESIEIHFTTKKAPMKVFGAEAQRVFDEKAYEKNTVEVTIDGNILAIPRSSILYTKITPHDVANELRHDIDELTDAIVEYFLEEKSAPYEEHDPGFREYLARYVSRCPKDWEYDIFAGRLAVGEGPVEDRKLLETKDPVILKKAKKLFKKMAELDQIFAGDCHV